MDNKILFIGFVTIVAILIGVFIWQGNEIDQFNVWLDKCYKDGGHPYITHVGRIFGQWECIKDGKVINHIEGTNYLE